MMRTLIQFFLVSLIIASTMSCSSDKARPINMDDVYPWCIVAFDSLERAPADRIEMLKDLGFDRYAHDGGINFLDDMEEELTLASENNMEVTAVWFWLNAKRDSVGKLSPGNEQIIDIVSRSKHKPALWVSFSPNFFDDLDHAQSLQLAADMLQYIHGEAAKIGCKVEIYNHRGWFGDIDNMVEIIQHLPELDLKIVYNFHHAQQDLEDYPRVIEKILPHLSAVNINGMKKNGPKILTVGEGDHERDMIKQLIDNGYTGPWGILGHNKEEDVRVVLERNIAGLKTL